MHKGIYLNVLMHVEQQGKPASADAASAESQRILDELARQPATPPNNLTLSVKRFKVQPGPDTTGTHVAVLAYMEGDQDAPQDFQKLATDDLRKRLDSALRHASASGLKVAVHSIEEATGAPDELADESEKA
ncbi:MAG TPA: hypothetical protein VKQ72_05765 [Aggregatilineales bacterium]|nr:hypothetical protein [Aggregatilineales bacterium]